MKRVIFAFIVLAVIITAGILETVYVDKLFSSLDDRLDNVEQLVAAEDESAYPAFCELSRWWEKQRTFLELFSYSPDVRNFSVALGETDGSLICGDNQNALSKLRSLKIMASNIHNILDFNFADVI